MKKLLFILLIFCAVFLPLSQAQSPKPFRIVTTFYPMYIMTLNIVGNTPGVEVTNLTPPVTGCLHDYALTARDMKKLSDADLLVANGAGMESFLDAAVKQCPRLKIIQASDGVPLLKGPTGVNPHVWVGISGAMAQVQTVTAGLEKMDSRDAREFRANAENYISKLAVLQKRMQTALTPYCGEKIITFHEAFPYFAKEFGFAVAAVVEREPGSAPSAKELAQTIELVKRTGIKVIFSEPQYPSGAAQTIARETGAKVLVLDPAVTGPMEKDAYLKIMEQNLVTLEKAFQGVDKK